MFQNKNQWDRLRVCAVGKSWPAEFYSWIPDTQIRSIMERIALETEEDFQNLIKCLSALDVSIIRPDITITNDLKTLVTQSRAPMCPGDVLLMLNSSLIESIQVHNQNINNYKSILNHVKMHGNNVVTSNMQSACGAGLYQINDSIFFTMLNSEKTLAKEFFNFIKGITSSDNIHQYHQYDHIDGWFTVVTPGLIIAASDVVRSEISKLFFDTFFPSWEIVTLPPTLTEHYLFNKWSKKYHRNWWAPGHEDNARFTEFVDSYLLGCLGNIQETVFDLNMIVIDQHNVVVSHYNKTVFKKLEKYNVTPHLVPLRHATFWDGGVHCSITELHRAN